MAAHNYGFVRAVAVCACFAGIQLMMLWGYLSATLGAIAIQQFPTRLRWSVPTSYPDLLYLSA